MLELHVQVMRVHQKHVNQKLCEKLHLSFIFVSKWQKQL